MASDTLTSRIELSVMVEVTRPRAASWDMDAVAARALYDFPPVETTTTGNGESYPATVAIVGASSDSWGEREYRAHVRALADEVRERWTDDPRGFDASDATWEAVDGSAWVIYYAGQRAVIRWTENIEAADDVGDLGSDVREALTRIAFYALRADVEDALRREYGDPEDWTTDDDSADDEDAP